MGWPAAEKEVTDADFTIETAGGGAVLVRMQVMLSFAVVGEMDTLVPVEPSGGRTVAEPA